MAVSELPGNPNAVWTVKTNIAGVQKATCTVTFMPTLMFVVPDGVCVLQLNFPLSMSLSLY